MIGGSLLALVQFSDYQLLALFFLVVFGTIALRGG